MTAIKAFTVAAIFWAVLAWDFATALFRTAILGEDEGDQLGDKL